MVLGNFIGRIVLSVEGKAQLRSGTLQDAVAVGHGVDAFRSVETPGQDQVSHMTGIHGNTFHFGWRKVVLPSAILFEPVAEDSEHEILDARKFSAALPLADDMFCRSDTDHLDAAERPIDTVRAVVGIELHLRAVDVGRHDTGRGAPLHFGHQRDDLPVIGVLQSHGVERRWVVGLEPCAGISRNRVSRGVGQIEEIVSGTFDQIPDAQGVVLGTSFLRGPGHELFAHGVNRIDLLLGDQFD